MSNKSTQKPHIRKYRGISWVKSTYVCELRFYRIGYGSTPLKAWRSFLLNNQSYWRKYVGLEGKVHTQEKS